MLHHLISCHLMSSHFISCHVMPRPSSVVASRGLRAQKPRAQALSPETREKIHNHLVKEGITDGIRTSPPRPSGNVSTPGFV